jgi:hypothetical protein
MGTHDGVCNIFVFIAQNACFQVGREQLHVLPLITFNSFREWIDIVLMKNCIHTLANVVIVDVMCADLLPWSWTNQGFVAFDAPQAKERSYHTLHPINQFLPLAIEVFGCLHKQAYVFWHNRVNAILSFKGLEGLLFLFWLFFFIKQFRLHYKGCKHPPS